MTSDRSDSWDPVGIDPALAVQIIDVTKRFGDFVAVRDLSLEVGPGEFFAMLGPSGCGKTTTLKMMAGFEQPTQGVVAIEGADVSGRPAFQRDVNMVFQDYALFPHLDLRDNVAFGLKMKRVPRGERRKAAEEMLERVHLPGLGRRRIEELSGGQRQRVALARALINRPKVLLLDEPLGALDLKLRKAMQLELKEIQRDVGISFVYVTHDQEEALAMADRIAVMDDGRALQVDTPIEIHRHPSSRFVADFIGESSFIDGKVLGIRNGVAELETDGAVRVRARLGGGSAEGRLATAMLRPEDVSLEAPGSDLPSGDDGTNRLDGVIEEIEYGGSDTRYFVRVDSRTVLVSRMRGASGQISTGDAVRIGFSVEDTVLLGNDNATSPGNQMEEQE